MLPLEARSPPGASRRAEANYFGKPDVPHPTQFASDPQRRVARIIARKFALRFGVALVVASAISPGGAT